MPAFYIDTDDGTQSTVDSQGQEMIDAEDARRLALATLPDMARDVLPDGDDRTFTASVRDADSVVIYVAKLTLHGEWVGPRRTRAPLASALPS